MTPVYSFVIPIYNEEQSIPEIYRRLNLMSESLNDDVEIILVDDGSCDRSLELMRDLQRKDPRLGYISFARNFGHQIL